jgi:RNA polymerase sigma factor (TIGR02999 family)
LGDVTKILQAIADGDKRSTDQLFPLVYEELRRIASTQFANEKVGQTLQPTALVHEAYLRLVGPIGSENGSWDSRGHFFTAAAEAMRRILIDNARRKHRLKRGGEAARVPLSEVDQAVTSPQEELLALDEALQKLESVDAKQACLVKLRFFAGLTAEQAAATLGISISTAERKWAYARAWLRREMKK